MKFCSECGQSVTARVPDGDTRSRFICDHCETIHYQNPRIVAGCLAVHERQVLLCKRAIEPRMGYWTLPAGFMEQGETVEEAARREAREEANAEIRIDRILAVYSVPRISQVQIMFRAELVSDISPGPESLEVELFDWRDIPWSNLAFPTVLWGLTHYAETRSKTVFAPFSNPPGTEALTR